MFILDDSHRRTTRRSPFRSMSKTAASGRLPRPSDRQPPRRVLPHGHDPVARPCWNTSRTCKSTTPPVTNNRHNGIFDGVDGWTVLLYVLIVLAGFVSIISASYDDSAAQTFSPLALLHEAAGLDRNRVGHGAHRPAARRTMLPHVRLSRLFRRARAPLVAALLFGPRSTARRPGSSSVPSASSPWSSPRSPRLSPWPA